MEIKALNVILSEFGAFATERGFSAEGDIWVKDTRALKISYNEDKRVCSLLAAAVTDGEVGEFATISDWLVDDATSENDAKSVVLDFSEATDKLLGIKKLKNSAEIKLPSKAAAGETPTVSALCQKFLAIFPQYKETYKEHVAKFGGFLPITFFKETAVPELNKLLKSGNTKQLGKMVDMLSSMYAEGDREVGNMVAGVIIAGAIGDDKELYAKTLEVIESPYLKPAVKNIVPIANKNSKYKKVFE